MACSICKQNLKRVVNAGKAASKVVRAMVNGERVWSEAHMKYKRLQICKSCRYYKNGWCDSCGCNLAAKTTLATESCPEGKW